MEDAEEQSAAAELAAESAEEYGKLLRFTVSGYLGGLALAGVLDAGGHAASGVGQWAVRTLSGEGESLFEGFFALRQRVSRARASMAEAYGWGKFAGMAVPWVVDAASRMAGVDVRGIEGFYIPFFYAMTDQIGASVAGFLFLRRRSQSSAGALRAFFRHPVTLAGLIVILIAPAGLLTARLLGFQPSTQIRTALETIAANLCWVPPLAAWLVQRRRNASSRRTADT